MLHWLKRKGSEAPPPAASAGQTEAAKALGKAEQGLAEVKREGREILATAEKLRRLGQQNDFAARIKDALGGAE